MRALTACITAVLGLGLAAMAACSSTASDTAAGGAGGSGGSGGSGGGSAGTGGAIGAAGDLGAAGDTGTGCTFEEVCAPCAITKCAAAVDTCMSTDDVCDLAFAASPTGDSLIACGCDKTKTATECATTFAAVDANAKAVVDCVAINCVTECGL